MAIVYLLSLHGHYPARLAINLDWPYCPVSRIIVWVRFLCDDLRIASGSRTGIKLSVQAQARKSFIMVIPRGRYSGTVAGTGGPLPFRHCITVTFLWP